MITVKNLTKRYKSNVAVDGISLDVKPGRILGILGPNGAGKSTTIKSIVGGVIPTSGSVEVDGKNPVSSRTEVSRLIGYMPQNTSLYSDLTALENVKFFADIQRTRDSKKKAIELLEVLGLGERINSKVGDFSGGMKTRVSLACALVHDPEILILDEPTAGLDPALKKILWKMFGDIADSGKTVLISTHLMEEAVRCSELIVIQNGKIIMQGTPDEMINGGSTNITVTRKNGSSVSKEIESDSGAIADYFRSIGVSEDIVGVDIKVDGLEDILIKLIEEHV